MDCVSIRDMRKRLSRLIEAAERGESVTITKRGRKVAMLVPAGTSPIGRLPDLTEFRASLKVKGRSLTDELLDMRREERF
ncbi:MAG TPA: type II toxin-antitoxin system prevent-host-death family antitoxin [Candidatus Brocadiia bacterium]|nr:type II toxin-antitoxin system prevent-host-death family antitoxin [Candidatus Brocadiia bacterium]